MSTATTNISLPGSLKGYIKERMEEEHYDSASDYIRAVIREERRRREEKSWSRCSLRESTLVREWNMAQRNGMLSGKVSLRAFVMKQARK
jgi:Arc/MetJ-type ribon-helix-helix transcriptional regulator